MCNSKQLNFKIILLLWLTAVMSGCAEGPSKKFVPPVFPSAPDTPRFIYERTFMSSVDVKPLTESEKFQVFATGMSKQVDGLIKPFDIAVKEGRIYVTDTVKRAILMFDVPNKQFKIFGNKGAGMMAKPLGISISDKGEVFVVDGAGKRVVVFSREGDFLRSLGSKELFSRPSGIAVSGDGKRVYVVDTGGVSSPKHNLLILDGASGKLIKTIGKRGKEDGNFNLPLLADSDKDGNVYVVDSGNFRIQKFSSEGEFVLKFGKVGKNFGNFGRPKGVAVDNDGNIYVVDASFGNFQIFNGKGELLLFIGNRGNKNKPAKFALPSGIDVDEDGRIYVVDQYFRKVDVFRPYALKEDEGFAGIKKGN